MSHARQKYDQQFRLMEAFLLFQQNVKAECIEDELTSTVLIDKVKLDNMLKSLRQQIKESVEMNVSMYSKSEVRTALEFMDQENNSKN